MIIFKSQTLEEHEKRGDSSNSSTENHADGSGTGIVCGFNSSGDGFGSFEVHTGCRIVQSSNHGTINAQALVCRLEGGLDSAKVSSSLLSGNHVVGDEVTSSFVARPNGRYNSESKDDSFGFGLLAVDLIIRLPGVSEFLGSWG